MWDPDLQTVRYVDSFRSHHEGRWAHEQVAIFQIGTNIQPERFRWRVSHFGQMSRNELFDRKGEDLHFFVLFMSFVVRKAHPGRDRLRPFRFSLRDQTA